MNGKITIFEKDEKIRLIIGESLTDAGLEDTCFIGDMADYQQSGALVYLCDDESAISGDTEIAAGNVFVKPLRMGRLIDRIKQLHAGQAPGHKEAFLKVGAYELDPLNNLLLRGEDDTIRLTEKETAILRLLHDHKGQTLARQKLLDEVWGYAKNVETHTLETHIYRLRQKIEDDAGEPKILLTEESGYRLEG